jgi:hypothetical protein
LAATRADFFPHQPVLSEHAFRDFGVAEIQRKQDGQEK